MDTFPTLNPGNRLDRQIPAISNPPPLLPHFRVRPTLNLTYNRPKYSMSGGHLNPNGGPGTRETKGINSSKERQDTYADHSLNKKIRLTEWKAAANRGMLSIQYMIPAASISESRILGIAYDNSS